MSQSTPTPDTTARTETAETVHKYRIGDPVRVVRNRNTGTMSDHCFPLGTVRKIHVLLDDGSGVDLGEWCCGFDEIEPAETVETVTVPAGLDLRERMALHLAKQCFDSIPSGGEARLGDVISVALGAWDKAVALASPQHPVGVREAATRGDLESLLATCAEIVRTQNGNLHEDINGLLAKVDAALSHPPAQDAPGAVAKRLRSEDVEWVTNDIAELGVKIGDQFFFLYKGRSIVYGELDTDPTKPPVHDDGSPMHWRPVFKREFGECAHPLNTKDPTMIGTVSLDDSDEWKPLPAAALDPSPPLPEADGEVVAWAFELANAVTNDERRDPCRWDEKPRLSLTPPNAGSYMRNVEPLVRQSALVSALRERDEAEATMEKEVQSASEDSYQEGYEEGLSEGRSDARGAYRGIFRFIYKWLDERGLIFDDGEGINADDVAEGFRIYKADGLAVERQTTAKALERAASLAAKLSAERAAREKAEQVAAGRLEALVAVDQHDRSNFVHDVGGASQRASWRGAIRKVRAALRASTEEGKTATPSVMDEEAGR